MNDLKTSIRITTDLVQAIRGFGDLKKSVASTLEAFKGAQDRVAALAREISAADKPSAQLVQRFERAKREAAALKGQFVAQREALELNRRALKAQGVDVGALASEYSRLKQRTAEVVAATRKQARLGDARQVLGLGKPGEAEREIRKIQVAFERLRRSGTLSQRELARAALKTKTRILELRHETGGLGQALAQVKGQALALVGALAGVTRAVVSGARDLGGFERKMAEISTLTEKTPSQLTPLARAIRTAAQDLGQDATDLAQATYNLISSGVPDARVMEPLVLSAKAAKAGVSDVNSAARLGQSVINAYDLEIGRLGRVFDVLFVTVRNGVTTIPELADQLGDALPTARAAGVRFEELTAAIAQLTQGGIRTPQAITGIRSAIDQLAAPTPEAKKRLQVLGIEWNGLLDTLAQIREKGLDLEAMRRIVPDAEGAKAVNALVGSYDKLVAKVRDADQAAGAMDSAFAKIEDSDPSAVDRWTQAWAEFKRQLGELVSVLLPVLEVLTKILRVINDLPGSLKAAVGLLAALKAVSLFFGRTLGLIYHALQGLVATVLPGVAAKLATVTGALDRAKTGATAAAGALGKIKVAWQLLVAAIVGWGIGTYLREQFQEVEQFGIAMMSGLHQAFVRAKGGIETVWEGLKFTLTHPIDALRERLASLLLDLSSLAAKVPGLGEEIADGLAKMADGIRPGTEAAEAFRRKLAEIRAETERAAGDVDAGYFDLFQSAGRRGAGRAQGPEGHLPAPNASGSNPFDGEAETQLLGKRLALTKAALEAESALVRDAVERQQRELDHQLDQHLVSYREYYARRRQLEERAADAEIRKVQANLDAQRQGLELAAKEEDRLPILADIKRLEAELAVLTRKRGDIGVQAAREQAAAERELADTLANLRATLASAQGDVVTARVTELVQQYRDVLRQLDAEGSQAGIELVKKVFDVELAKARMEQLQRDWDAALERMQLSEDRVNSARENGLITEVTARREIIHLHRQTYGELQRMLPLLEAQARIIGGDAPAAIARLRTELEDIGRVTDEVAARINDSVRTSLTEFLDSIGEGSANARDMLLDLVRTARRIASERIADAIAVKLNIGGKVSGALGERGNSPAAPVYVQDVTKALVPGSEIPGAPEAEGLFSQVTDWVSNLGAQIGSALSGLGSALGGLLNSLASAVAGLFGGGGSGLSSLTSLVASLFHTGGIGASPLMHRRVSAELFAAAPRFHSGNAAQLLGLGPRELPAIIRDDEEVLTRSDPRHVLNGGLSQGGGSAAAQSMRMVLVDDRSNIGDYMASSDGERVIVQAIRRNSMTVRQILGG